MSSTSAGSSAARGKPVLERRPALTLSRPRRCQRRAADDLELQQWRLSARSRAAIERITGQSLEDVLRERIFEPVGMHDTRCCAASTTDFVPNSATLHMTRRRAAMNVLPRNRVRRRGRHGFNGRRHAALAGPHGCARAWAVPTTWQAMKTPQTLANGTSTGYGLGLMTDRYRGAEILYHDGGVKGGNSRMVKVPDAGLDIVVMVNRQDVNSALRVDQVSRPLSMSGLEPGDRRRLAQSGLATGTFQSPHERACRSTASPATGSRSPPSTASTFC